MVWFERQEQREFCPAKGLAESGVAVGAEFNAEVDEVVVEFE